MTQIVKARIENGVVVEAYLLLPEKVPLHMDNWVTAPVEVGDGWQYDGTTFTPPTAEYMWNKLLPFRQNMRLTFAQLLIGVVDTGWMSQTDAEMWADGTLPTPVTDIIATLPAQDQFAATMKAKRPTNITRVEPLVLAFGTAVGATEQEMDDFFVTYSQV